MPYQGSVQRTQIDNWDPTVIRTQQTANSGWGNQNHGRTKVQPSGAIPQEHNDDKHITRLKNSNSLEKTQFSTSESYINKLRFSIELDQLYQVYDSCCTNQEAEYCPVLVKVGSGFRDWGKFDYQYLLQVWSRRGKLLYELPLLHPIANWNIHDDYFVFQEAFKDERIPEIQILKFQDDALINKFSLALPLHEQDSAPIMSNLFEKVVSGALKIGGNSLSKNGLSKLYNFSDEKIIPKKIGIAKNHLIISKGSKVYYYDLQVIQNETPRTIDKAMNFFEIAPDCELLDIMDIGNKETVLILCNMQKHLVFYRVKDFGADDIRHRVNVKLVKLGLNEQDLQKKNRDTLAQPVQVRAVVMHDNKKVYHESDCEQQHKFTCSAVVLREDKSFEFYSDFNMVSSSRQTKQDEKQLQCQKISVSNDGYLLLVNRAGDDEVVTLYEVSFSWGNLLGMSVATKMKKSDIKVIVENINQERKRRNEERKVTDQELHKKAVKEIQKSLDRKLEAAVHRRISPFFRIFTQFFNYNTFMLVAHRHYVSVFDLKSNGNVNIHFDYEKPVMLMADSKQGIISVLLQNNEIFHIEQSSVDGIRISSSESAIRVIPGRIVNFCSDINKDTAVYFLMENSGSYKLFALFGQDFIEIAEDRELDLNEKTQIKVFYKQESDNQTQSLLMVQGEQVTFTIPIYIVNGELTTQPELEFSCVFMNDNAAQDIEEPNPVVTQLYEKLEQKYLSGRLVGAVTAEGVKYGSRKGFMAKITTEGIEVYDQHRKLVEYYTNPCIQELVLVDETYVYCLCEASAEPMKKYDFKKQIVQRPKGASISKQQKGLYVYDIERLLTDGSVENYYLAPAAVGMANQLDFSDSSGRLSYFTNFKEISMLPFPHRNTINFLGMGKKEEYLIWRESQGFFTALHESGQLRIWTIGSGKFVGIKSLTDLPEKKQQSKISVQKLKDEYEIYNADLGDTCYTKGFQNFANHSIQLLKKKEPELIIAENDQIDNSNFKSSASHHVETIIAEQDMFEFLVLKLTTGTDKKKKKKGPLQNIRNKLTNKQEKPMQASLQAKVLMRFIFPLPKDKNPPQLHLSKDCKKLMEVVDKQVAVIYKKDKDLSRGSSVVWKKKHLISQYPTLLQGTSTLPFLFEPNFNRYIDVDYAKGNFVIKSVDRSDKKRDWPDELVIPKSLLSLSIKVESDAESMKELVIQNEDSIRAIAKRMHFFKKNMIRIINSEGIDTLYDLSTQKIVVFSKRDNLNVMHQPSKSQKHFFLEREDFDVNDLLSRLVYMTQNYKGNLEFAKYELTCRQAAQKEYRKPNLLTFLYKVEYRPDNFMAQASFTLLDWIICERIQNDPLFDLNDIDRQQQIQLCFNIFPKAKTILHMLALNSETNEQASEQSESIGNTAQKLFSVCKKGLQSDYKDFKKGIPFELPIIEDMLGHTVLDIALERHDLYKEMKLSDRFWDIVYLIIPRNPTIFKNTTNDSWFKKFDLYFKELKCKPSNSMPSLNSQLAMTIFANIQNYGYLHSSSIIYPSVIEAIKVGLPNIGEYLDQRLVESQHMPNKTQHDLSSQSQEYCHTGAQYCDENEPGSEDKWLNQSYNTVMAQLWEQKTELETKLFKKEGVHKNMIIRYLDVPLLHTKGTEGIAFIRAMRNLSNNTAEDVQMNIYGKRSVQIVINEHWGRTYYLIIAFLFIPYVGMLVIYSIWSNFTLQGTSDWAVEAGPSLQLALEVMALYFLGFELIQFVTQPVQYLMEGWSYIKTIPMVLVLINTAYQAEDQSTLDFWQRQALCGFCMWLRLLYFMRSISFFSYFIRMLMQVVWKIKIFVIILTIAVFGFADTFYSLSTSTIYMEPYTNADGEQVQRPSYILNYVNSLQYSYEIVIGQFADDLNDQDSLSWFFFILASIISMLVLANLLIEIVAETYGEVTSKKYLFVFKERVELICDWQSDMVVVSIIKSAFMLCLKPFFWCLRKMEFRKQHAAQLESALQGMQQRCQLLMTAWEDPENKDQTNDVVEDENVETAEEKIDIVKNTLNDMKVQLGLSTELNDEFDESEVQNPIQSIQLIHDNLQKVIERLGLNLNLNPQNPLSPKLSEFAVSQKSIRSNKASQPPTMRDQAAIKYKRDEIFDWQAKRNN